MTDNFSALHQANLDACAKMDAAAGAMVKQLFLTLERRTPPVYIKLSGPNGHEVDYGLVPYTPGEDESAHVKKLAQRLGMAITATRITVPRK